MGYYYPRSFVKSKFNLQLFHASSKTDAELDFLPNYEVRDGEMAKLGIRLDGHIRAPQKYYDLKQIVRRG